MPGVGEKLDHEKFMQLAIANVGRRGFTYTHKANTNTHELLRWATKSGFTVNASADTLVQADRHVDAGLPTVVVLPQSANPVTCQDCGLCAVGQRKSVVGFPAHGIRRNLVTQISIGKRVKL